MSRKKHIQIITMVIQKLDEEKLEGVCLLVQTMLGYQALDELARQKGMEVEIQEFVKNKYPEVIL